MRADDHLIRTTSMAATANKVLSLNYGPFDNGPLVSVSAGSMACSWSCGRTLREVSSLWIGVALSRSSVAASFGGGRVGGR